MLKELIMKNKEPLKYQLQLDKELVIPFGNQFFEQK